MELAEERLKYTDLPVKEIAAKIGISNPYYFTALFKKKKGIFPSAYRKKFRQDPGTFSESDEDIPVS